MTSAKNPTKKLVDIYTPTGFEKIFPDESAAFRKWLSEIDSDEELAFYLDDLGRRYPKVKAAEVKRQLVIYKAMQIFTDATPEMDARLRQRSVRARDIKILKQASDIVMNWLWLFPSKSKGRKKGKEQERDDLRTKTSNIVWRSVGERNLKLKKLWRDDLDLPKQLKWLAVAITRLPTFPYIPRFKGRKQDACVKFLATELAAYFKRASGKYLYEDIGELLYRTWPEPKLSKKSFKSRGRYYVDPRWVRGFKKTNGRREG